LDFAGFSVLDFFLDFFKKNEEVICAVHLLIYLVKFGEGAPQYFDDFFIKMGKNTEGPF
jgi:hypothetical protein